MVTPPFAPLCRARPLSILGVLGAVAIAACAGPTPVSDEELHANEAAMLAPLQAPRRLIATTLDVTVSPNFFNDIGQPALDPGLHQRSRSTDDGSEVWTFVNREGGVERPLRVLVGRTEFLTLHTFRLAVLPSGSPLTFRLVADGDVTVIAEGAAARDVERVEVRDGVWHEGR